MAQYECPSCHATVIVLPAFREEPEEVKCDHCGHVFKPS